jgi:hypothetical protein
MVVHKEFDCELRPAECEFCTAKVPCKDLSGHQRICGARTRPCSICSKLITLKSMADHLNAHEASFHRNISDESLVATG